MVVLGDSSESFEVVSIECPSQKEPLDPIEMVSLLLDPAANLVEILKFQKSFPTSWESDEPLINRQGVSNRIFGPCPQSF